MLYTMKSWAQSQIGYSTGTLSKSSVLMYTFAFTSKTWHVSGLFSSVGNLPCGSKRSRVRIWTWVLVRHTRYITQFKCLIFSHFFWIFCHVHRLPQHVPREAVGFFPFLLNQYDIVKNVRYRNVRYRVFVCCIRYRSLTYDVVGKYTISYVMV